MGATWFFVGGPLLLSADDALRAVGIPRRVMRSRTTAQECTDPGDGSMLARGRHQNVFDDMKRKLFETIYLQAKGALEPRAYSQIARREDSYIQTFDLFDRFVRCVSPPLRRSCVDSASGGRGIKPRH